MDYIHTKTNIPQENDYPKLVRDKIPQIIKESDGHNVDIEIIKNTNNHFKYLQKKIVEEANELKDAKTKDHIIEEIVDVLEIIDTICDIQDISKETILNVQAQKRQQKGGFLGGIVMKEKV